jgi:transcriptional regulator of acetoin/glycerol metabolism
VLFASDGPLEPWHLSPEARGSALECVPPKTPAPARRDVENRARLIELLEIHGGTLRMVADALKTSRSLVHRRLRRFKIDIAPYRS